MPYPSLLTFPGPQLFPGISAPVSGGDRQLVRLAVAAYFGGTQVTDGEVKFQGGPLTAYGLGTAYPYSVRNAPDTDYYAGQPAGQNWGCVMSTVKVRRVTNLDSYGGIWARKYTITCDIALICELEHIEVAEQGLDNLIDQVLAMVFADPTLGTNSGAGGVRILTAGTDKQAIADETDRLTGLDSAKGRYAGEASITFQALTMIAA